MPVPGRVELIAQASRSGSGPRGTLRRRLGHLVPEPVPRPVRSSPGRARRGRGRAAARPGSGADERGRRARPAAGGAPLPAPAPALPQAGDASLRLLRRVGVVDPASLDDYRAHGGYAALRRALELGAEGVLREVKDSESPRPRRRRVPDRRQVGGRRPAARAAALPRLQRRRVRARDVQGPGAPGGRPVRRARGDDRRGGRDGLRARLRLPPRGVPTGRARALARDRRGPGAWPARRRRDGARRRVRRRAAARGGRVHLRGGDGDLRVDRGQARRAAREAAVPGRGGSLRRPDRRQQRRDARQRPRDRARLGRGLRELGTERSTGTKLLCVSGHVERPGTYEVGFGATLREVLELAGGIPAVARCRRCSSAALRGASSARTTSTCR